MDRRVLRVVGWAAALIMTFIVGAAAGGGIVFAATQALSPDHRQVIGAHQINSEQGIVIASVDSDGPAATAGIKRGDILLKIDDEAVDQVGALIRHLRDMKSGDIVELIVQRGEEQRTLMATLGDRDGRSYLGVVPCGGLPRDPTLVTVGTDSRGARVIEVMPDSPADEAGLEAGDLIFAVDGQTPRADNGLSDLISNYAPGDTITVEVISPGRESREVTIRLAEHPEEAGAAYLGVRYLPAPNLHPLERGRFHFGRPPFDLHPFEERFDFAQPGGSLLEGAIVRRVAEGSPAEDAGLGRGDVITAIAGEAVDGPGALAQTIAQHEPGDLLVVSVYRPESEETSDIEVTLAEHPDQEGVAYLGVLTSGFYRLHRLRIEGNDAHPGLDELRRRFHFELPLDRLPFDLRLEAP